MNSEISLEQREHVKYLFDKLKRSDDLCNVAQMVYSDGSYPTDVRLAVAKSVKATLEAEISENASGNWMHENHTYIEKIYWINAMSALLRQLPSMEPHVIRQ